MSGISRLKGSILDIIALICVFKEHIDQNWTLALISVVYIPKRCASSSMMRSCLSIFIAALFLAAAQPVQAEELADLRMLISWPSDPHMDSYELAFLLATHNFQATPKDGYVLVFLDEGICKLIPNGKRPGLADICVVQKSGPQEQMSPDAKD
ncbi:MAG: hypothetical protein A4E45_00523 [Methanosaeta sp. PtaB.Bin039]|nr:MAG: hypothetical protein A4E45_00523 [Methanosaeta sp. PtaB.Bin039]